MLGSHGCLSPEFMKRTRCQLMLSWSPYPVGSKSSWRVGKVNASQVVLCCRAHLHNLNHRLYNYGGPWMALFYLASILREYGSDRFVYGLAFFYGQRLGQRKYTTSAVS